MNSRKTSTTPRGRTSTHGLQSILSLCRKIKTQQDLPSLLHLITKEAKRHLDSKDASLLLFDQERCELWSYVTLDGEVIRFDARLGIAGAAAMTGKIINVADAYQDSRFYPAIDTQSKKRTRSLLALPIRASNNEILGVLEVMNKKSGSFTSDDEIFGAALAEQAALSIDSVRTVQALRDEQQQLLAENSNLWRELEGSHFATQHLIGTGPRMQSMIRLIDQIRDSAVDVLITGENGTGKELVAKAIHYSSARAKRPFVALNCAAIPEHLVESELLGIESGVATGVTPRIGKFEQANGGTLFLDEIGDLGLNAQAKILRVLQERSLQPVGGRSDHPIDIRILAATNKNLESLITEGTFRQDLYFRLKVLHIHTPALREIPEDIPLLASHFLSQYCRVMQKPEKHLSTNAQRVLQAYQWPGNARELENEIKRIVVTVRRVRVSEDDLDQHIRRRGRDWSSAGGPFSRSLHDVVGELEQQMIREALDRCSFNQVRTANLLGLSRQGLLKKMERLGIPKR